MIDYNTRRSHKCSKYGAPRCALQHLLFCLTGRSTLCSQMRSCPIARFFQTHPLSFHDNWLLQNLTFISGQKGKLILCICVLCLCVFSVLPWLDKLSDKHCTEHQKRRHDGTQCGCACFCYFGNCSCILCTWNQNLQYPPPSWPWSNNRAPQKSLNQIKVY